MSNPLTFPVFFLSFLFSVAGLFLFLVFFFFSSSSFLPARCIVFFFSFCSFRAGLFLLLLMVCSCFYFFLLLSIPAFFSVPLRWCRVVMLKTVAYSNQVRYESLKNSAGTCTKLKLCYIVIYTFMQHHNDTTIKTQEGRTQEDFFNNIFTSHFICKVCERVVEGLACERVLETEHKLHILTPLLWPSRCVFLVLLLLGSTPSGVFRGPPRSGVAFPTTSGLYCLEVCWQLLWDPNSTELNNNSTPTRSPTGSLNRMFNRHQAEITVMQFRGYSLPVHHC